jgi:hypothetical protein
MRAWGVLCAALIVLCTTTSAEVFEYGIVGDAGRLNARVHSVRTSLLKAQITHLIMPGDNLYDAEKSYDEVWAPWRNDGFAFDLVCIGNHTKTYADEIQYFQMPGEYFAKQVSANVKFLVLNSDNEKTAQEQAAWFERELLASNEKFLFVMFHHPSYTLNWLHWSSEKLEFQNLIRPLLIKYRQKLTALIVGHDHIATYSEFGGLPVILSGATHDVRWGWAMDYNHRGLPIRTKWYFDFQPYWVRLTIDDTADYAKVEYLRAKDNKVRFAADLVPGLGRRTDSDCSGLLAAG